MILAVGAILKKTIIATNTKKENRKSIIPERIADIGMIMRGKYIFLTIFALDTTLAVDCVNPFAKNVHGTKAAKLKIG